MSSSTPLIAFAVALTILGSSEALTREEALDKNGICRVNGSFPLDCNTCHCTTGRGPACTKIGCNPPQEAVCTVPRCSPPGGACITLYKPVCGFKVEFQTFINSCQLGGIGCRQGFRYFSDGKCNSTPHGSGLPAEEPLRSSTKEVIPLITKENALDRNGICKINGSFPDDCNSCSCTKGSPPICTLRACAPKEPCILPPCALGIYFRCSDKYDPVCAIKVEFKTFSNSCHLGGEGCRDGFTYFKEGVCEITTAAIE